MTNGCIIVSLKIAVCLCVQYVCACMYVSYCCQDKYSMLRRHYFTLLSQGNL